MEAGRPHLRWAVFLTFAIKIFVALEKEDSPKFQLRTLDNGSYSTSNYSNAARDPSAVNFASDSIAAWARTVAETQLGVRVFAELRTGAGGRPAPLRTVSAVSDWLRTTTHRIDTKISAAASLLNQMRKLVVEQYVIGSFVYPCPVNSLKKSTFLKDNDAKFNKKNDFKMVQFLNAAKHVEETLDLKIKRQYFMAAVDGATDKNCWLTSDDSRLRRLFHNYFQPFKKHIILIIDNNELLSAGELQIALSIAIETIGLVQKTDLVTVITRHNNVVCYSNSCVFGPPTNDPFSDESRELLLKHINKLEISNETIDIQGEIFEALEKFANLFERNMIAYIGNDLQWLKSIRDSYLYKNITKGKLLNNIIINICKIGFGDFDLISNDEIALPNCEDGKSDSGFCQGININFNSSYTIGQVSSLMLLSLFKISENQEMVVELPIWDPIQKDLLVPFVMPCSHYGAVIVDLYLSDLAQEIIYFNPLTTKSRAFLIDFNGNVIIHSSYSRPEVLKTKPKVVDISLLETATHFNIVKPMLFANISGNMTIENGFSNITYVWKWVKNFYILCVANEFDNNSENYLNVSRRITSRTIRELQYHRIDLLPPTNGILCRHFKQVSTIEKGTLYLSPSSFQSPFKYLHDLKNGKDMSLKLLQSCMAYLKDNTRLLSNPGLKQEIRNDVGLLYPMLNYYKGQHIYGSYNKYIVRRYAATDNGVLVMFPGSILESDYEPNRKAWFKRAVENPGRIMITPPYLDIGGAGYIVTSSFAPKDSVEHLKPATVLSMDITMGFLYKILEDSSSFCTLPNMHCFMMDDQGYLLSHPSLFDRSETGPIEQQHITHKESFIANDILNHQGFVQKKLCKKFEDGTLQRYYSFNISIDGTLTNIGRGEHCTRYYIIPIEGTNAFLGMVNSTCNIGAFCPCSVVDRLCLNCKRMEQNECECPCECTMSDTMSSVRTPMCKMAPEKNNYKNNIFYNLATHLKSCFDFQCDSYGTESNCLGVMGCEWCHLDADGESTLSSPFCSTQTACFGGILGAITPYGEGSLGHVMQDDALASYSAVGPIAGCIVAVCLILAIAVYCYKQNLTMGALGEAYMGTAPDAWPETGMQMSHMASEDDIHDERSANQDKLLLGNDLIAVPISPYRVVTGYRRPNTTGESDHGYSTMTPHDDSEHLAFALVEPFISADADSEEAIARSNVDKQQNERDPITVLPCGKNSIIASVTVHRNMEAT